MNLKIYREQLHLAWQTMSHPQKKPNSQWIGPLNFHFWMTQRSRVPLFQNSEAMSFLESNRLRHLNTIQNALEFRWHTEIPLKSLDSLQMWKIWSLTVEPLRLIQTTTSFNWRRSSMGQMYFLLSPPRMATLSSAVRLRSKREFN